MSNPTERLNVILMGKVGSVAYGLDHAGSDIDRLGIFVAPLYDVLGLKTDKVTDHTVVEHEPDKTLHEVGKYLLLALQCNPTVLELLYLPEYEVKDEFGQGLVDYRFKLLSAPAVKGRYGGYATAQAERLKRRQAEGKDGFSSDVGKRTEKHGRHCARLLLQGSQLLRDGFITVDVSEHRDYLFDLGRLALRDADAFYDRFVKLRAEMDSIDSLLPDEPDRESIQQWLVGMRMLKARPAIKRVDAILGLT